jgi:hypothetical protein
MAAAIRLSQQHSCSFLSVAGSDPASVARRLLADAEDWLATSGITPVPTSHYLKIMEEREREVREKWEREIAMAAGSRRTAA